MILDDGFSVWYDERREEIDWAPVWKMYALVGRRMLKNQNFVCHLISTRTVILIHPFFRRSTTSAAHCSRGNLGKLGMPIWRLIFYDG